MPQGWKKGDEKADKRADALGSWSFQLKGGWSALPRGIAAGAGVCVGVWGMQGKVRISGTVPGCQLCRATERLPQAQLDVGAGCCALPDLPVVSLHQSVLQECWLFPVLAPCGTEQDWRCDSQQSSLLTSNREGIWAMQRFVSLTHRCFTPEGWRLFPSWNYRYF